MASHSPQEIILLHGNSHPHLAHFIGQRLGVATFDSADVTHSTSKETEVNIKTSVRGRKVFILQTGCRNVNDCIMEMLIMIYACKTSGTASISAVVPYMPYAKQSKMRKRGSVASSLIAKLMEKAGVSHVITVDLNPKEIQGFFTVSVENLRASPYLVQYVKENIPEYRTGIVVARNPNSVDRAASYAERLGVPLAVVHGVVSSQAQSELDRPDGRSSPVPLEMDEQQQQLGKSPGGKNSLIQQAIAIGTAEFRGSCNSVIGSMTNSTLEHYPYPSTLQLVGDVSGRIAFIVDVIIDDVDELILCAELLKSQGATNCYVLATHGLFSADAPEKLESSKAVDYVIVTNTVPQEEAKARTSKIRCVDLSPLLAEAIRRVHYGESLSYLFRNVLPSGD